MRRTGSWILCIAVIVGLVLIVPLLLGIWLPDVFSNRIHVLGERPLSSTDKLLVIQCWNHRDFYNTELVQVGNGRISYKILDSDDDKHWQVSLDIEARVATVHFRDGVVNYVQLRSLRVVEESFPDSIPTCASRLQNN